TTIPVTSCLALLLATLVFSGFIEKPSLYTILNIKTILFVLLRKNIKRTKIFVTLALFCFVSEHHLDGKAATKKVGVHPILVWWR
ncbi:hypothetical protein, partial [Ruminococcus sp.]|uniref:hypothetical protein n=1 Tax=Ruminococcus sp. TaxID=41978 RepID=UPI003AB4A6A0